jgi:hypothetical protein
MKNKSNIIYQIIFSKAKGLKDFDLISRATLKVNHATLKDAQKNVRNTNGYPYYTIIKAQQNSKFKTLSDIVLVEIGSVTSLWPDNLIYKE